MNEHHRLVLKIRRILRDVAAERDRWGGAWLSPRQTGLWLERGLSDSELEPLFFILEDLAFLGYVERSPSGKSYRQLIRPLDEDDLDLVWV